MANIAWKLFLPYIAPNVSGCPAGVMVQAIRNAAIEFCENTRLWKLRATGTDILKDEARYAYDTPSNAKVIEAVYVAINNSQLVKTCREELDECCPEWRETVDSRPKEYFMDTANTIRLVGIPSEDILGSLDVDVAVKPSRSAVDGPDFLFENWVEVIAHGALARLHAMAGNIWADPSLVKYHRKKFRHGISKAKSKELKSRQTISRKIKYRPFGEI